MSIAPVALRFAPVGRLRGIQNHYIKI